MIISANLMHEKHGSISGRQFFHRSRQHDSVNTTGEAFVVYAKLTLRSAGRSSDRLLKGQVTRSLFPKVHEHRIHRDPIQPGGKSGFAAEIADLAEYLEKCILGEVFRFADIARHPKTQSINFGLVSLKQARECFFVTFPRLLQAHKAKVYAL